MSVTVRAVIAILLSVPYRGLISLTGVIFGGRVGEFQQNLAERLGVLGDNLAFLGAGRSNYHGVVAVGNMDEHPVKDDGGEWALAADEVVQLLPLVHGPLRCVFGPLLCGHDLIVS